MNVAMIEDAQREILLERKVVEDCNDMKARIAPWGFITPIDGGRRGIWNHSTCCMWRMLEQVASNALRRIIRHENRLNVYFNKI
jgi:hypothetical protein